MRNEHNCAVCRLSAESLWEPSDIGRRIIRTREAIQNALIELILEKRSEIISESDLPVPGEYLLAYMLAAYMGKVQTWQINGCHETAPALAKILVWMSYTGPFRAFGMENQIPDDL